MLNIKFSVIFIVILFLTACSNLTPTKNISPNALLGRYAEYILVIENGDIDRKADDFLSKEFYSFSKDEIEEGIDLKQRGTVQFTYMPLGELISYSYKVLDEIYCLKLDGTDINKRKVSILLDYVLEDEKLKINKVYTKYLESDPYDPSIICADDDDLLKCISSDLI